MMQYLAWRVMSGLNKKAEISFMLVGHTKFSPDWCFGLVKQRFRRTKVGCLDDIVRVVEESSVVNHVQLVGREDGTVIERQYNWSDFFGQFLKRNAFAGIKSLHHLVFSSDKPGIAMVRETTDGAEKKLTLLTAAHKHWKPSPMQLPPILTPEGLSQERRQYLFEKIREFCPPHCRDIVCPNPNFPTRLTNPSTSPPNDTTGDPPSSPSTSLPTSPSTGTNAPTSSAAQLPTSTAPPNESPPSPPSTTTPRRRSHRTSTRHLPFNSSPSTPPPKRSC